MKTLNTLHKVIRTTYLNNVPAPQKKIDSYIPVLKRGNIVRCEFIGIGTEIDETHFAIVWNAPESSESVTVIPTTSQPIEEGISKFCIGKVNGLITGGSSQQNKETYVYLNKIKEVSRRRLKPWNYTGSNGQTLIVTLDQPQINRVKEAIRVSFLDENYLLKELLTSGMQLPFSYPANVLEYGYRVLSSITIDKSNTNEHKVNYCMLDGNNGTIEMFNPSLTILTKECSLIFYMRVVLQN